MIEINQPGIPIDLSDCDRNPIDTPGAMLVLDAVTLEILEAAGDTTNLLGVPIAALRGTSATALFSREQAERLHCLCTEFPLVEPHYLLDPMLRVIADRPLHARAHRSAATLIVEFEAAETSNRFSADPLAAVQGMGVDLDATPTIAAPCQLGADEAHPAPPLAPRCGRPRLLVVEDSVFVIMALEAMCEDLGWEIVGPATRVDDALELVEANNFDVALLDVNLDGQMSWNIAVALEARGIPFAFGTGYDVTTILPPNLAGSAIFSKPYRMPEIERHIRLMLETATPGAT